MSSPRHVLLFVPWVLSVACAVDPPKGTNIGALRGNDPSPQPPSDTKALDMTAAVEDALRVGGLTTLNSAWAGHIGTLVGAPPGCPQVWLGPLPEDLAPDAEFDEDTPGMSWAANCTTDANVTYAGFSHWSTTLAPGASGTRTLVSDAQVLDGDGGVLFEFDGEAQDSLDAVAGTYSSVLNGELKGSLVGLGSGYRTGGDFEATWSADGTLRFFGTMTALDGFGPEDHRNPDPEVSPELADVEGWVTGMPRFTSAKFDLEFTPDCPQEPVGYVGLRGNEGFWFDVYFLPLYADTGTDIAQQQAFPFEEIENVACDGVGTLFARNVNLGGLDAEDEQWSREVAPSFAAVAGQLAMPTLEAFVYTVRDIPTE
ncbi:MAG: hypothetical protein ABMA64_11320 [Myxococcota bacterium]